MAEAGLYQGGCARKRAHRRQGLALLVEQSVTGHLVMQRGDVVSARRGRYGTPVSTRPSYTRMKPPSWSQMALKPPVTTT